MIRELVWDSNFFGRKIGELILSEDSPLNIKEELDRARMEGYEYIIFRTEILDTGLIKLLTSSGFYLTDIGITWGTELKGFILKIDKGLKDSIIRAGESHMAELKEMMPSIFIDSRFYNDPFFTQEEADRLFATWIENSVKGVTADIVFYYPEKGFVGCKKEDHKGRIVLIGVKKNWQNKGIGKALMAKAIEWCLEENLESLQVRTQLRNMGAMNFYSKLGFRILGYDLVFGNILIDNPH